MKTIYLFIACITLCLGLQSCKPDEPAKPAPKDWYIPQEVLDYFYFQPGTYWVYENDKTLQRDSIWVSFSQKGLGTGPNGDRYEVAECRAISSLDGYTYKYGLSMQGSAACIGSGSPHPCYSLSCYKYKIGDVLGESIAWDYPFLKGYGGVADYSGQSSQYLVVDYYDSFLKYNDVVKVNISNALVYNRKDINNYWAKNIGIVKKENITDAQNWNLISYNIVK